MRKWWLRHANQVSIASVFIEMDWIRRRLWRTVSSFQLYLTRIAHESFFRHPLYMVTSKLEYENGVTSCKSCLHRIGIHTDGLYATQTMKNSVKLQVIPPLNRPRIIFPSSSIHGHVLKLNKEMVVTSCRSCLSHRYSCKRIVYDAGYEEQCQTFNYTSPESPTNHFSVILYTWSRLNLNKKMGLRHANHDSIASVFIQMDCLRHRQWRTVLSFKLYHPWIGDESFFRHPQYMVTSKFE